MIFVSNIQPFELYGFAIFRSVFICSFSQLGKANSSIIALYQEKSIVRIQQFIPYFILAHFFSQIPVHIFFIIVWAKSLDESLNAKFSNDLRRLRSCDSNGKAG